MNKLYYGDCFSIMQDMPLASVDLIYLDPPFNSNRQYNSIYKDETGRPLPDQIHAFNDMWELDPEREKSIKLMPVLLRENGIDDSAVKLWNLWMQSLRGTQPRLLAYLSYMTERLLIMWRILKPTGTLYFHCDPTVSHYMKPILDAIFGHRNFRNEIIWKRTNAPTASDYQLGFVHDTIFSYAKSPRTRMNPVYIPYSNQYLKQHYRHHDSRGRFRASPITAQGIRTGSSGQPWRSIDIQAKGLHWVCPTALPDDLKHPEGYKTWSSQEKLDWLDANSMIYWPKRGNMPHFKRYLSTTKGTRMSDVITDVAGIQGSSKERMGYDTQKPLKLLERLIQASSNPGDVVLDPFCGCATTLEAAHSLGREWIGIDIAFHCINRVVRLRLKERLGLQEGKDFTVTGVPLSVEAAQALWKRDTYHFQQWAVEMVDGFVTSKRTADGGIDGRLYFDVPGDPDIQSMVLEVKGGRNVNIADLRALKGVLDNDEALLGGLIVLHPLGVHKARNFNKFMADAGLLKIGPAHYPKLQILTVAEILEGKRFETPWVVGRHELQPRMPGVPR